MISAQEDQLPVIGPEVFEKKLRFANSTLPFVAAIVKEIEQISNEHLSIRTRLGEIDLHRHLDGDGDLYSEELKAVEESADQLCDRLEECYRELNQIKDVSFDSSAPSHLDFCLETDDGTLHLCWKLGESSVSNWHWSNETCDHRRPIEGIEKLTKIDKSLSM